MSPQSFPSHQFCNHTDNVCRVLGSQLAVAGHIGILLADFRQGYCGIFCGVSCKQDRIADVYDLIAVTSPRRLTDTAGARSLVSAKRLPSLT